MRKDKDIKGVELKIFNEQQESYIIKINNNDSLDDYEEDDEDNQLKEDPNDKYNFKTDLADSNYMRYYKDKDLSADPEMIHVQTRLNEKLAKQ